MPAESAKIMIMVHSTTQVTMMKSKINTEMMTMMINTTQKKAFPTKLTWQTSLNAMDVYAPVQIYWYLLPHPRHLRRHVNSIRCYFFHCY